MNSELQAARGFANADQNRAIDWLSDALSIPDRQGNCDCLRVKKVVISKIMMQTIEAVIDEKGKVHLLESVKLDSPHRVFITILPNPQNETKDSADITNLGEILDEDFESARKEIVQSFFKSIEKSAQQLEQN